MLRGTRRFLGLAFVIMFVLFPAVGIAGWELYDDFSSGSIDPARWDLNISGGSVSVEKGKAKLVQNNPSGTVRLYFKDPQSIKGVKVKVYVVSASNDFSARIGTFMAQTPEGNPVYQMIDMRPERNYIHSSVETLTTTFEELCYLFHTSFLSPSNLIKKWFTISIRYPTPNNYTHSVSGQGSFSFKLPPGTLIDGGYSYVCLMTKSMDGIAAGTVYFDNVYVYK